MVRYVFLLSRSMVIINMRMLLTLLAPFVLTLQMHTDMGDERGIRLRCICLGDAALRGSRMSARGICSKVSEPCFARSFSRARLLTGSPKARSFARCKLAVDLAAVV